MLILPLYEPEINNDADVMKYNIETIYAAVPHDSLHLLAFYHAEQIKHLVAKVKIS